MNLLITKKEDLYKVSKCHIDAFPESLVSSIGIDPVIKMLSWYVNDERGLLFHLEQDGEIVGYCGCLLNRVSGQHGSATSMTQYGFWSIVKGVITKPRIIFTSSFINKLPFIIRNIRIKFGVAGKPVRKNNDSVIPKFIPSIGLVVIGVSSQYQGKGYGGALLKEFDKQAVLYGFTKAYLSVNSNNSQAINAYLKHGWQKNGEHSGEWQMVKNY